MILPSSIYEKTDVNKTHNFDNSESFYKDDDIILVGDMSHYSKMNLEDFQLNENNRNWIEILFCFNGSMQWISNGVTYSMIKNMAVIMPLYDMKNMMMSLDAKVMDIRLSNHMLYHLLGKDIETWQKMVPNFSVQILNLKVDSVKRYVEYLNLARIQNDGRRYNDKIMHSIVKIVLFAILNDLISQSSLKLEDIQVETKISQSKHIFDSFINLLNQSKPKRHPIGYFADKLSITPKYLSTVCFKQSGKTAADWIQEATLEEVHYYLTQTMLSMKDVAHVTGFVNEAFFGKYVKQHFGSTPLSYRRRNG